MQVNVLTVQWIITGFQIAALFNLWVRLEMEDERGDFVPYHEERERLKKEDPTTRRIFVDSVLEFELACLAATIVFIVLIVLRKNTPLLLMNIVVLVGWLINIVARFRKFNP